MKKSQFEVFLGYQGYFAIVSLLKFLFELLIHLKFFWAFKLFDTILKNFSLFENFVVLQVYFFTLKFIYDIWSF